MDRQSLIAEYDAYFTEKPGKWAVEARNKFAVDVILNVTHADTILDIGCGNGHTLAYFGNEFPDAKLYGIDISPVACDLARENSGAVVECTFIEDYHPDMKFDIVLCMGTAEHFEHPVDGLKSIRELTGGYFYLEAPNNLSYSPGPSGNEGYRRLSVGSHQLEWHWTREQWEQAIAYAGFEVVRSLQGLKPAWEFVWLLK